MLEAPASQLSRGAGAEREAEGHVGPRRLGWGSACTGCCQPSARPPGALLGDSDVTGEHLDWQPFVAQEAPITARYWPLLRFTQMHSEVFSASARPVTHSVLCVRAHAWMCTCRTSSLGGAVT